MRLYVDAYWFSPYAFSSFVALTEKGVPFETVELALQKGEQKQNDFPRRSCTGRIPCLVDAVDGTELWLPESSAIAEYLDERLPPPQHRRLLPAALVDRARARMTMAFLRSDLLALREERSTATMFYERAKHPLSAKGQAAAQKLLDFTEALLPAGGTHLFGDWCLADAELAFMLQRLGLSGHPLPRDVANFVEAQWARPSVKSFINHARPAHYDPY